MEGHSVARAGDLRPVPGGPPGEAIGGDGIGHTGQIAKLVDHEDCNLTISRQCEVFGIAPLYPLLQLLQAHSSAGIGCSR